MAKKNKVKTKGSAQKSGDTKGFLVMILAVLSLASIVLGFLIHLYVFLIMEGIYSDFSNDTAETIANTLILLFFVFGFMWAIFTSSVKD